MGSPKRFAGAGIASCMGLMLFGMPYRSGLAGETTLEAKSESDQIVVTRLADKQALVTQNAGKETRPYLHPILSPDGGGVLTEFSPGHHRHQTGLYWGFTRVNGRDYFHNLTGGYWQRKGVRVLEAKGNQAKWQVSYDLLGADKTPELTEVQNWTMTDHRDFYTLDLKWQGTAAKDVVFGSYSYGGLFLRMPFAGKGEAVNSDGLVNGKAEGKRARWVDVGMPIKGRAAKDGQSAFDDWGHIVVMDHPMNDGHPNPWRVDNQLGVGPCRARLGEWKLPQGKTATILYRMLVYTGKTDKSKVEASWEEFVK